MCMETVGVGVNRPGAYAEYLSLPMSNVWRHDPTMQRDVAAIFDPFGLTTVAPTAADVTPDDSVLLVGYPQADEFAGRLAMNIGRVLTDTEAEAAIEELAALGDEEGGIAYDPEVEMLIDGHSVVGMSGGGVYDRSGSLVGILVRGSYEYEGKQYVRAVRMTYVITSLMAAYEALSDSEKATVRPYFESMPTSTSTPSPTPELGGILGFPVEHLLAGLAVVTLVLWSRKRSN